MTAVAHAGGKTNQNQNLKANLKYRSELCIPGGGSVGQMPTRSQNPEVKASLESNPLPRHQVHLSHPWHGHVTTLPGSETPGLHSQPLPGFPPTQRLLPYGALILRF